MQNPKADETGSADRERARGGIVDEDALADAIEAGQVAGASPGCV